MNNFENGGYRHQATTNSSGTGVIHGLGIQTQNLDQGYDSFTQSNAPRSTQSNDGPNRLMQQEQVQVGAQDYQYINKQVNNVKLVNKNSLTLNVRNYNNRINNININHI